MSNEYNNNKRWTKEEEEVLRKIIFRGKREGKTMAQSIMHASYRLGRSEVSCSYRWNNDVASKPGVREVFRKIVPGEEKPTDTRYVVPKEEPKTAMEDVTKEIMQNPIYSKVLNEMLAAQRKQVAYGMDKYVETLNPNSWSVVETIDHIISETVDKLHYLAMLKIKLIEKLERES